MLSLSVTPKKIWIAASVGAAAVVAGWALWPSGSPDTLTIAKGTSVAPAGVRTTRISDDGEFGEISSVEETRMETLRDIATEQNEIERNHRLQAFVDGLPVGALSAMVVPLTRIQQDVFAHDLWLRLVRRWGNADPRAAAAWATALSGEGQDKRREAMHQVAISWANIDLKAAETWVASWPGGAERDAALTTVAYEGARTDPVAALQFAVNLPPSRENSDLITHSISQWAARDAPGAWGWARQVEDPEIKAMLESNIVVTWAVQDPVTASRMVGQIAPGRAQDDAIVGVAEHWVQRDPAAARRWVQQLTGNGGTQAVALRAIDAQIAAAAPNPQKRSRE